MNERFRRASRRFEMKGFNARLRMPNTYDAIRQIVRREVLSAELSRAIVRRSGALSEFGDYLNESNNMKPDIR